MDTVAKDCKNVATVYDDECTEDMNEELWDDTKWFDWTDALTYDDWSDDVYHDCYQDSYWFDDQGWWTDCWDDNWTWEMSNAPTVSPALPQLQNTAASSTATSSAGFTAGNLASSPAATAPHVSAVHAHAVTEADTGDTLARTRTGSTHTGSRTVQGGPGLFGAFVATVAVLNSFGQPQGLPLIPETVSHTLDFPDMVYPHTAYGHEPTA